MRTRMLGLAAVVAGGLGTMTAASASPMAIGPFDGLRGPPIERVADGCGPGFHANPWGRCRPNDRGYGYGPPRGYYGPPRGYGYDRGYDRPPPRRFYDGY
jgi:hypothetical protein